MDILYYFGIKVLSIMGKFGWKLLFYDLNIVELCVWKWVLFFSFNGCLYFLYMEKYWVKLYIYVMIWLFYWFGVIYYVIFIVYFEKWGSKYLVCVNVIIILYFYVFCV